MKVLFFYIGTPTPILETELELIRKHDKDGDKVTVFQCSGNLPNCHWNIKHNNSQCATCVSKFENGWRILNHGKDVLLKEFTLPPQNDLESFDYFANVNDIESYQHDGENIGYGVVSTLISRYRDHRFDTRKHYDDISRTLRTAVHVYDTLKNEIITSRPNLIYLFNGRIATHLPAKILCAKYGIDYYSYEVSQKNNCYTLLKNKTTHDSISVEEVNQLESCWTPEKEMIGNSILIKMRSGSDLGKNKIFIQDQLKGTLPDNFNYEKNNIAIFNSTIDEYAGIEGLNNKIYIPDETAGICKILESFESDNRFFFYLRVHPHMKEVSRTISQLVDIRKLSLLFSNVKVIWPEEKIDTYALLDACEKVITFGSTVGIEATFWGKPSILADQAKFENFNYTYSPKNHDELIKLLKDDGLEPMHPSSCAKIIYLMSNKGVPFESFKENGFRNDLATGTFDGVEIKPNVIPALKYNVNILLRRVKKSISQPSLLIKKIKSLC
jgi:hypothetical protein